MVTDAIKINEIEVQLVRHEGQYALVSHEVYGAFYLPLQLLPAGAKENDKMLVKVSTKEQEEKERFNSMRKFLEQMIN